MKFEDYCNSLPREVFLEIASLIKYKTIPEKDIISRYHVTSWFLNNLKQRLSLVQSYRDDALYNDYLTGRFSIEELMNKYNLERSRVSNIITNYRKIDTIGSKELF